MHGLELLYEALQGGLPLLAQLTRHSAQATAQRASQADSRLKVLEIDAFSPPLSSSLPSLRGLQGDVSLDLLKPASGIFFGLG